MTKTTKILSDGTIAKVNMIVVVIEGKHNGNKPNTITKISKLILTKKHNFIDKYTPIKQRVLCLQNPIDDINYNWNTEEIKNPSWVEYLSDLRKATPKECKQYYKELNT